MTHPFVDPTTRQHVVREELSVDVMLNYKGHVNAFLECINRSKCKLDSNGHMLHLRKYVAGIF